MECTSFPHPRRVSVPASKTKWCNHRQLHWYMVVMSKPTNVIQSCNQRWITCYFSTSDASYTVFSWSEPQFCICNALLLWPLRSFFEQLWLREMNWLFSRGLPGICLASLRELSTLPLQRNWFQDGEYGQFSLGGKLGILQTASSQNDLV